MNKVIEVTKFVTYKTLVLIEVPDDVQWQIEDYNTSVDNELEFQNLEVETGNIREWRESHITEDQYFAIAGKADMEELLI